MSSGIYFIPLLLLYEKDDSLVPVLVGVVANLGTSGDVEAAQPTGNTFEGIRRNAGRYWRLQVEVLKRNTLVKGIAANLLQSYRNLHGLQSATLAIGIAANGGTCRWDDGLGNRQATLESIVSNSVHRDGQSGALQGDAILKSLVANVAE